MKQNGFKNTLWATVGFAQLGMLIVALWLAQAPWLGAAVALFTLALAWHLFPVVKAYRRQATENASFETMLANVHLGVCIFDGNFNMIKWNTNYAKIMEHSEEILRQKPNFRELVAENFDKYSKVGDNKAEFIETTMSFAKQGVARRIDRRFKNGKIVEISYCAIENGDGFVLSCSDVTTSRLAEKALQESENRFRRMIELSPDAIIAHKDGFIIYVNNAALKLLKGRDQHDIIGKQINSFFPTRDLAELSDHFGSAEHLETGENLVAQKSQIINDDGRRIDVEVDATALLYGDTKILQLIIHDISARVQIEEFLQHAKEEAEFASQLKGTFLANMSHELRTPLNAVIGFSEVIKKQMFGPVGSEKYVEYAEDIRASGTHLLELINNILDFSKIESGEQSIQEEDIEIDTLVNECVRLTQQRAIDNDINIKLEFDPLLPRVFGDRRMLKQILINLLSNAIKFTPAGGRIVTAVQVPESAGLRISVTDNGIGIKEGDIEKALTPFVQIDSENNRKHEGTGLGLPLSKNLAELHEGNLVLESTYGEGTVVSLVLPKSRIRRHAA